MATTIARRTDVWSTTGMVRERRLDGKGDDRGAETVAVTIDVGGHPVLSVLRCSEDTRRECPDDTERECPDDTQRERPDDTERERPDNTERP